MTANIAVIGAGSAVFALSLVRDLCLTPNLAGSRVIFMDIDEQRLQGVHALCQRFAKEIGISLQLDATTDRRAALKGADFVINTALSAGHERLRAGWEIGRSYGYRIGGSLHIMHDEAFWINFSQYRLFESIIEDILDLCPQAWYLQVANPVFAGITYLGRKYPAANIVGLCHGYRGVYHLAQQIGLDPAQIEYDIPGVNHFVFLTRLRQNGQNCLPLINDWLRDKAPDYWKNCHLSDDLGPKPCDLYRRLGVFPIGDTATPGGGAWPYWYHSDDTTEQAWKEDPWGWYQGYFTHTAQTVKDIQRIANDPAKRVTAHFAPQRSGEVFIDLVEAIACGVPKRLTVNIPNRGGLLPGVPQDVAVEVQAACSAEGIRGIATDGLPPAALHWLTRDRIAPMEMELAAYQHGSREFLLQLILMDPYTHSLAQAEALLADILAMLGNESMAAHYR